MTINSLVLIFLVAFESSFQFLLGLSFETDSENEPVSASDEHEDHNEDHDDTEQGDSDLLDKVDIEASDPDILLWVLFAFGHH